MKFQDGLMAELVNPQGLLIIGTRMFRYTNAGILHIEMSAEENVVADLMAAEPSAAVSVMGNRSLMAGRDQVVAQGSNGTAGPSTIWDVYGRVTNTYSPITQTRQVWVPENCDDTYLDCGPTEDCDIVCTPGYWRTITEVIGESLDNSRLYAYSRTYKKNCFIICFGESNVTTTHSLSASGAGINQSVNQTTSRAVIEVDLPSPRSTGSISISGSNLSFSNILNVSLVW